MIAYALRETGNDPAWLIGALVPQLGSNAGAGEGWLVVEGDESDRTVFGLPAEIAVVTNVDLDHHSEFRSLRELEDEFDRWAEAAPHAVRDAPPFGGALSLPGEHNRLNAGTALAALELAGVTRDAASAALARFTGTAAGSSCPSLPASRSSTTTPITRPSSPRRSPRRGRRSRAAGCWRSSSHTSTRARATWPASSRPPLPRPTTSS